MFGRLGATEILVILILLVIVFGHSKIPGMMKNLANGVNVFKRELKKSSKESEEKSVKAEKTETKKVKKTGKSQKKKKVVKK